MKCVKQNELGFELEFMPLGSLVMLLRCCSGEPNMILSEGELLQIVVDIASGVQFLHSLHFFVGDIKSANVLVALNFRVKLADFGNSEFAPSGEISGKRANNFK